jgi:hypothetical protein
MNHLNRIVACDPKTDEQSNIDVKDLYARLLEIELQKKRFKCTYCTSMFTSKKSQKQHERNVCKEAPRSQANVIEIETQYQVQIYNFGEETVHHIINDAEFMHLCLQDIEWKGFRNVIAKTYFDTNVPQNNTVVMKSMKKELCEVFKNDRWEIVDTYTTINEMIEMGYNIFNTFLQDKECLESHTLILNDICTKQSKRYKQIRKQIYALLVNQRALLQEKKAYTSY